MAKPPKIGEIVRHSTVMLEDLRHRLETSLARMDPDEVPTEAWIFALEAYSRAMERQASTWLKLREAARKVAASLTAAELDAHIAKELEGYMIKSMPEDRIRHVLAERAGGPVEVIPSRHVVTSPAPTPAAADPWDEP